jgi:hypothetical protein
MLGSILASMESPKKRKRTNEEDKTEGREEKKLRKML